MASDDSRMLEGRDLIERSQTLSETVADRLQLLVMGGDLRPGERLPSERELGERFGVSRTVIREAVRRLAGKGLINSKAGGGVVVGEVGVDIMRDPMNRFLLSRAFLHPDNFQEGLQMIHEVRTMLEVQIAGVAARSATPEDVSVLHELARALEDAATVEQQADADVELHRNLAMATHNDLYVVLLDSIRDPLSDIRVAGLQLQPSRLPDAIAGHARIVTAVEAGDVEAARREMARHLADSKDILARLEPKHLLSAPTPKD